MITKLLEIFSTQIGALDVRTKRKTRILLTVTISLLLPLLSVYMNYYVLMEADFLSQSPKFENTDLDSLLVCEKQKFTVLNGLSHAFLVAINPVGHLSCFNYQATFSQVAGLVLRC